MQIESDGEVRVTNGSEQEKVVNIVKGRREIKECEDVLGFDNEVISHSGFRG